MITSGEDYRRSYHECHDSLQASSRIFGNDFAPLHGVKKNAEIRLLNYAPTATNADDEPDNA
jgi:hypothetical protein